MGRAQGQAEYELRQAEQSSTVSTRFLPPLPYIVTPVKLVPLTGPLDLWQLLAGLTHALVSCTARNTSIFLNSIFIHYSLIKA